MLQEQDPMVEVFAELAIALLVIIFRVYARGRLQGFRNLQSDDYLMMFAGCLYSAEAAAAYYVNYFRGLSVDTMSDLERATLDPSSQEWSDRTNGSKIFILGWMTYTSLLWCLKACMVVFFFRLTQNVRHMKIRVWVGAIAVAVTYIAMVCVILFACSPIGKHWQINPNPGPQCRSPNPQSTLITLLVFNVTTDAYLILIPIPMVWRSQMGIKRKVALTTVFTGAILTTIFGVLRCVSILSSPGIAGAKAAGEWSIRESFVAVIVTNAALIYPYLSKKWQAFRSRYEASKSNEQHKGYQLGRYESPQKSQMSTKASALSKSRFGKKISGPYSVPDITQHDENDSTECINPPQSHLSKTTVYDGVSDRLDSTHADHMKTYSTEINGALRPPTSKWWTGAAGNDPAHQQQQQLADQDSIQVTTCIQIDRAETLGKFERGQVGFY